MISDSLRPARLLAEQERAIGPYLADEVMAYSEYYQPVLQQAGWANPKARSLADLARVVPTDLDQVDSAELLLRPDADRIRQGGGRGQRLRLRFAEGLGGRAQFGRSRIDPVYKPVHWTVDDGLLVASSAADLDRLAELGRRWLEAAGVSPDDSVLSIVKPGPSLSFSELQLGARRAGLSALFLPGLPSPAEVERLKPEVLAGRPDDLSKLLLGCRGEGRELFSVRTILAVDDPLSGSQRRLLMSLAPRACVLSAWAPPGVRSLWFECKGGVGLHTQSGAEVLEVVLAPDDRPAGRGQYGDILWTALGWRGTVIVRLRTGLLGRIDSDTCASCGRGTPRVRTPEFMEALEDEPGLVSWQAEMRSGPSGASPSPDELTVYLAPTPRLGARQVAEMVAGLQNRLGSAELVVNSEREIRARIQDAGGAQLLDYRE